MIYNIVIYYVYWLQKKKRKKNGREINNKKNEFSVSPNKMKLFHRFSVVKHDQRKIFDIIHLCNV